MSEPTLDPSDTAAEPGSPGAGRSTPGTPRWVLVGAGLALALVVLFAVVHLTGGAVHH